jgi:tetratricopeptide (TPR) repeat protein
MDFKRAGTIAWRRGDLDEAARCFDAAICDDVQDWESIAALASICLDQGKLGQAYALYANAARIDPTNAAILADIGRVLIAWGEYEDALPIFERAHRIDPHNLAAINNAAMACINLGRADDAARWLQAGRDIPLEHQFNADFSQIERNWAFVHLMRQDWPAAWEAFDLGLGAGDRVARNYGATAAAAMAAGNGAVGKAGDLRRARDRRRTAVRVVHPGCAGALRQRHHRDHAPAGRGDVPVVPAGQGVRHAVRG